MVDDTGSKQLAAFGRILSVLGYVLVGFGWFGDDIMAELGLNPGAATGPLVLLGFMAIAAGRLIKRRATPKSDEPVPEQPQAGVAQQQVPDDSEQLQPDVVRQRKPDVATTPPPVKARPTPSLEPLQKERTEVARSLEQVLADMEGESVESAMETEVSLDSLESLDVPPKTSAEMLEEAKHQFDMPVDES